ncbi:unnamed protein product [Periconia digitata]|uniref:Uncharacterized protein n=1 Tax=Periconia digitata TaxID=1303443 RepID=A0A9W4XRJ4_9PLEO|nr:unnamed protein product [Periconia digitata]
MQVLRAYERFTPCQSASKRTCFPSTFFKHPHQCIGVITRISDEVNQSRLALLLLSLFSFELGSRRQERPAALGLFFSLVSRRVFRHSCSFRELVLLVSMVLLDLGVHGVFPWNMVFCPLLCPSIHPSHLQLVYLGQRERGWRVVPLNK